jgi:phospholipase/lecithinase/hemolysin
MKRVTVLLAATLLGALVGCGDSTAPRFGVFSAGDSLSDSGTFGFRFTVQGTEAAPNRVWTELVAAGLGTPTPCPRYQPSTKVPGAVEANPAAWNCGGHAVAGARLNPAGAAGDLTALSVLQQVRDIARERRPFSERDLVLMSGGANDAADVFELWLKLLRDPTSAPDALAYQALMKEILGSPAADNLNDLASRTTAGRRYMTELANRLADTLKTELLDKGARRIVVVNIPDITNTPKFQAALTVPIPNTAPGDIKAFGTSLAEAFNQQLATSLANDSRIVVYNLFAALDAWISDPPPEFNNVQTPACPNTNPDPNTAPTYSINTCTAEKLSAAAIASGQPANVWQQNLFADDFHPTPRGHQEAAAQVLQRIRERGWN